jgi:hypothetical protein
LDHNSASINPGAFICNKNLPNCQIALPNRTKLGRKVIGEKRFSFSKMKLILRGDGLVEKLKGAIK